MNPEDTSQPPQQSIPPEPPAPVPTLPQAGGPSLMPSDTQTTRVPNTLPVRQPGERTFTIVKRHPIGMFGIYAMCGLVLLVTAALAFIVAPSMASYNGKQVMLAGALVFTVVLAICAVVALVAAKIYWGNTWTVTTDSLTQIRQTGLFHRESSQLSLNDIEDVSSEQNGVLAKMLNYGVLRVEVPGDSNKFVFPFCPNPNYYAQQVLTVREAFEQNRRAEEMPRAAAPAPPVEPPIVPPAQPPAGPGSYGPPPTY